MKPQARIFSGAYDRCAGDFGDISEPIQFAKQMAQTVTFVDEKKAKKIKQQLNACIRENRPVVNDDFDCDPLLLGSGHWSNRSRMMHSISAVMMDPKHTSDRIELTPKVMSTLNEFGTVKLVNRERFSYANFNNAKFNKPVCQ